MRDAWTSGAFYNRPLIDALSEASREPARRDMADRFRVFYDGESVRVPLNVRIITGI